MNVKKYRASTAREALQQVKQDLGENAFVLETKQVSTGGFLGINSKKQIEISATATLEPETEEEVVPFSKDKKPVVNLVDDSKAAPREESYLMADKRDRILNALSIRASTSNAAEKIMPASQSSNTRKSQIETVEISSRAPRVVHARKPSRNQTKNKNKAMKAEEARLLRAELREMKMAINAIQPGYKTLSSQTQPDFNLKYSEIYEYLRSRGIEESAVATSIDALIDELENNRIPESRATKRILKHVIENSLEFTPNLLLENRKIAFVGATGVGKTTTIAKLAARESLRGNKKVELLTLDTYRIAAVDQLKTYADIIGAKCDILRSVEELDERLKNLDSDTTALIDTTGRSPYDLSDQYEVSDFLAANDDIHKCLTIQASINPQDAIASVRRFEMYGIDSVVVTKLDETSAPGAAIQIANAANKPMSYICVGQRVPEDIRIASVGTLISQIVVPTPEFQIATA